MLKKWNLSVYEPFVELAQPASYDAYHVPIIIIILPQNLI